MKISRRRGIITHWDIDGLASAVILSKMLNPERRILSSVNSVARYIGELVSLGLNEIWIADLNPASSMKNQLNMTLERAKRLGVKLYWFDHHQWSNDMINLFNQYSEVISFINESSMVASHIVANYFGVGGNEYYRKLISLAYDDDFFENRFEITRIYRRVLKWDGWDIRYRVLESLLQGELEPRWLIEYYVNEVKNLYENLIREAIGRMEVVEKNGARLLIFPDVDPRVHPGELIEVVEKQGLLAHAYIVRYPRGISLRSDYVDVSKIASLYGGGGHPRVAGIPGGVGMEAVLKSLLDAFEKHGVNRPLYIA
ncbi:DHH family phosphoesterase [Thermosphaera aggregans]|uniref:Phosphohydrolase n=1 Tax=Thermosphaera aggregans (strain DSM 11486 / M11TL) TaxID=633148 RepID=D5U1B2_THEAM|nr:DHH family phosphoesterase [Thermosphaera aggregans]ADG90912.1 hypothetical protein Tagg_0639 [Thermosphaera aggregans DSM 11486]